MLPSFKCSNKKHSKEDRSARSYTRSGLQTSSRTSRKDTLLFVCKKCGDKHYIVSTRQRLIRLRSRDSIATIAGNCKELRRTRNTSFSFLKTSFLSSATPFIRGCLGKLRGVSLAHSSRPQRPDIELVDTPLQKSRSLKISEEGRKSRQNGFSGWQTPQISPILGHR